MAAPGTAGRAAGPGTGPERLVAGLYRDHHRPLMALVLRLTGGDRRWAEEVVQETMIRAWRGADRLDPAAPVMPWLAAVARRIVIDQRRRRGFRPPEVTGGGPPPGPAGADGIDRLLRRVVIADALESLPAPHREVLTETVLRGRTAGEAARVLDVPAGTVKSRVYHALRALHAVLRDRGVTA
ncbi:sigma-70 family RNA polymerase sigma factor [Actinomadura viridis]|uniref:RNA polymerase sigma factor n=1 Tax=Actinomadura viridis TaxID=58110 RepID=A0A931DF36_9ACTN|nr:sigma-70 family RNA polymerase sigma factor [Actinomadura viridis]MBG6087463.1 RNA polymerase sigma-70 factor (ECF subfamily) [Actinomadura viridis]